MNTNILGWMALGAALVSLPKLYGYYKHITNKKVAYDKLDNHVVNFHFTFLGLAKVEDVSKYGRTKEELCDHLKWIDSQVQSGLDRIRARKTDDGHVVDDISIEVALTDLVITLSHVSDITIYFIKETTHEPHSEPEQDVVHS